MENQCDGCKSHHPLNPITWLHYYTKTGRAYMSCTAHLYGCKPSSISIKNWFKLNQQKPNI